MFQFERREQIMERVLADGRVDVTDLAEVFNVTGETIRRDLTELQRERLVRRVHGGAIPFRESMLVPILAVREEQNVDEKRRIAAASLAEIPESGAVIIDSGSTSAHLADLMDREGDLTVITNSIPIARSLATTRGPDVMILGGTLRRRSLAFVDEVGVDMLQDITADLALIGCDGVSLQHGFTTPYREEVAIKRAMMSSARRTVMMFDHSKVLNDQLLHFAAIEEVDAIYTGVEVDEGVAARMAELGPVVVRA